MCTELKSGSAGNSIVWKEVDEKGNKKRKVKKRGEEEKGVGSMPSNSAQLSREYRGIKI